MGEIYSSGGDDSSDWEFTHKNGEEMAQQWYENTDRRRARRKLSTKAFKKTLNYTFGGDGGRRLQGKTLSPINSYFNTSLSLPDCKMAPNTGLYITSQPDTDFQGQPTTISFTCSKFSELAALPRSSATPLVRNPTTGVVDIQDWLDGHANPTPATCWSENKELEKIIPTFGHKSLIDASTILFLISTFIIVGLLALHTAGWQVQHQRLLPVLSGVLLASINGAVVFDILQLISSFAVYGTADTMMMLYCWFGNSIGDVWLFPGTVGDVMVCKDVGEFKTAISDMNGKDLSYIGIGLAVSLVSLKLVIRSMIQSNIEYVKLKNE